MGLFIRTIGIARAKTKIGLANRDDSYLANGPATKPAARPVRAL